MNKIIMGIDPSINHVGWGIVGEKDILGGYAGEIKPQDSRFPIILAYGQIKIPKTDENTRMLNISMEMYKLLRRYPEVTEYIVEKPGKFARGRVGLPIISVQLLQSAYTIIMLNIQTYVLETKGKTLSTYTVKPRAKFSPMRKVRAQHFLQSEYNITGKKGKYISDHIADAIGLAIFQYGMTNG